jgi:YgiT-type zinc finger domain-containing protein
MTCDLCGKERARVRRVTRSYGSGGDLLVIERIPTVHCPDCGGSYLEAETLHQLERIKMHRAGMTDARTVAVASFVGRKRTNRKKEKSGSPRRNPR